MDGWMFECVDHVAAGGIISAIVGVVSAIGGLFGGGREESGSVQQPIAPDVTQSQDQQAAAKEARNRQLAAQRNSTTATSGLGTQTQAGTTSNKLG